MTPSQIIFCVDGFELFRKDCSRHGGGVCLAEICLHGKLKSIVGAIYRPPSNSVSIFIDSLSSMLYHIYSVSFSDDLLMGDINVDLSSSSKSSTLVSDCLLQLKNLITSTRVTLSTSSF